MSLLDTQKISIIMPAHNEEHFIEAALREVLEVELNGFVKEIIVVNDGSTDQTKAIVDRMRQEYSEISLHSFKQNKGKSEAVKYGFMHSSGDIVVVQDCDLEYKPSDLKLLIEPFITQHADVVYGSRFISHGPHRVLYFWHMVANKLITLCSNVLTNLIFTDVETGYKMFRGDLIRKIAPTLTAAKFGFEIEITAKIAQIPKLKIYEIGISYFGRTYAEGKKIGWKDGVAALWYILYFNVLNRSKFRKERS